MAIINLTSPFAPGSKLGGTQTTTDDGLPVTMLYGTTLSYVGACIRDYERNGRDDSDFHMIVWDDAEGKTKDICFASTRGWSYPCYGSSVDATPEVLAKVEAYRIKMERSSQAADIRAARKEAAQLAADFKVGRDRAARLILVCIDADWKLGEVRKLFTSNLRSEFRIKLRNQIAAWLADDAPKYDSPLSVRQWPCLHPDRFSTAPRGGYKAHRHELAAELHRRFAGRRKAAFARLAGLRAR